MSGDGFREEVLNGILAQLLNERGVVSIPEQSPRWPLEGRRMPDVLVVFQGLRTIHYYCMLFGIETPKKRGIDGREVDLLWREKKHQDIAEYCWGDVKATGELFKVWSTYIRSTGDVWLEISRGEEAGEEGPPDSFWSSRVTDQAGRQ